MMMGAGDTTFYSVMPRYDLLLEISSISIITTYFLYIAISRNTKKAIQEKYLCSPIKSYFIIGEPKRKQERIFAPKEIGSLDQKKKIFKAVDVHLFL